MENRKVLLSVKDLEVKFRVRGRVLTAIRGVSLNFHENESVAIVGESGSGKSVFTKTFAGMLETNGYISNGSVIFNDDTCQLDLTKVRKARDWTQIRGGKIATVFQDPMTSLNPIITIGKQITSIILKHQNCTELEARARALELMKKVGIPNAQSRFDDYPFQYSGGMRQRIVIAIALSCQPKILICDEPTTALDVTIQAQILRLMNDLQRDNGTAIIFITHDLGVINEMADDVVVMYCGQVVEKTSAKMIFTNCPTSHPYTEGLMYSIPRIDNITHKLEPIPGAVPHPLALPKGCKFAPRCKYATAKCHEQEPALVEVAPGQKVRCFYPEKEVRTSEEHRKSVVNNQP